LYGTSITGHVLWDVLMFPKGLNPSAVKPSRTFLLSTMKFGCKMSSDLHASPLAGCLNTPFLVRPSACHLICDAVCSDMNNLCNRGMSGNHLNVFTGRFFLDDMTSPSSSICVSALHLDSPHTVHESKSLLSFQNNIQSLRHVGIFSYPRPMELRNFFASYVLTGKVSSQGGNS
jgi:hypothetical protein